MLQGVLRMLEAARIPVGIITNGAAEIQRAKLARIAASSLFPIILVGHEELAAGRQEKPHASIFQSACTLAHCEPQQVSSLRPCRSWCRKGAQCVLNPSSERTVPRTSKQGRPISMTAWSGKIAGVLPG